MKVLAYDQERCIGCHTCEEVCSETWFKVTDVEKSRIRILEGETLKAAFCNQCGECIEVCPAEAIVRNKQGIVMVKKKLCVGCLSCVGFCPNLVMFTHPDETVPFKCVACGKCADECPAEALSIIEVDEPLPAFKAE